jgi:hypothetical protein
MMATLTRSDWRPAPEMCLSLLRYREKNRF